MNVKNSLVVASTLVLACSCKKDGIGGKATVAPTVKHHERAIPGSTVYIKYDADEFPGDDLKLYDELRVCNAKGTTKFNDLLPGHYYFYGVGYDSSIRQPVTGGMPLEIKRRKKTTIDLLVPVTE